MSKGPRPDNFVVYHPLQRHMSAQHSSPRIKFSGASRRARTSALRIVDVTTNNVLTGEEVPPSAVVTPPTSPEIVASSAVSAPVVMAADEVEAPSKVTAPFFSETEDIVSTPSNNTSVPLIEKIKAEEKTVPTVVASPTPSVPAAVSAPVGATPIIAVPVTQENGQVPSSRDPPINNITMTEFLPINFPANMKSIQPYLEMATDYASVDPCISRLYALEQGFILKRKEENLPFLLDLMQILGKNKLELQSKIETTDIPIARAYLQGVIQKLLNWAESAPPLVSFTEYYYEYFCDRM
uniref:Vta1/callose synthase N-terminal domain-containing protein n=1 Tax=Daphnia galeata TaxID=27404 RepID=A0A8J2SDP0_9CRUS|nr:unnamed protein product [Daphnia galeata]